jgi:hypothetical protein
MTCLPISLVARRELLAVLRYACPLQGLIRVKIAMERAMTGFVPLNPSYKTEEAP